MIRGGILELVSNSDELRKVLDPVVKVKDIRLVRNHKDAAAMRPMRDFAFIDCFTIEEAK
jgi:hypothetical protein